MGRETRGGCLPACEMKRSRHDDQETAVANTRFLLETGERFDFTHNVLQSLGDTYLHRLATGAIPAKRSACGAIMLSFEFGADAFQQAVDEYVWAAANPPEEELMGDERVQSLVGPALRAAIDPVRLCRAWDFLLLPFRLLVSERLRPRTPLGVAAAQQTLHRGLALAQQLEQLLNALNSTLTEAAIQPWSRGSSRSFAFRYLPDLRVRVLIWLGCHAEHRHFCTELFALLKDREQSRALASHFLPHRCEDVSALSTSTSTPHEVNELMPFLPMMCTTKDMCEQAITQVFCARPGEIGGTLQSFNPFNGRKLCYFAIPIPVAYLLAPTNTRYYAAALPHLPHASLRIEVRGPEPASRSRRESAPESSQQPETTVSVRLRLALRLEAEEGFSFSSLPTFGVSLATVHSFDDTDFACSFDEARQHHGQLREHFFPMETEQLWSGSWSLRTMNCPGTRHMQVAVKEVQPEDDLALLEGVLERESGARAALTMSSEAGGVPCCLEEDVYMKGSRESITNAARVASSKDPGNCRLGDASCEAFASMVFAVHELQGGVTPPLVPVSGSDRQSDELDFLRVKQDDLDANIEQFVTVTIQGGHALGGLQE